MPHLQLTLLGGFYARVAGGPAIDIATRKTRALLAYLALPPGRQHTRETLVALLWSDRGEKQAQASLRQALVELSRALAGADGTTLIKHRDTLALDPESVEVDAVIFEQSAAKTDIADLERAAALHNGDLLQGLDIHDPAFEEWLSIERERFRSLAAAVLRRLGELQTGRTGIATAERLIGLEPLQEEGHRMLMRLHAEAGELGLAVRAYENCRKVLNRELNVAPSAETEAPIQPLPILTPSRQAADDANLRQPSFVAKQWASDQPGAAVVSPEGWMNSCGSLRRQGGPKPLPKSDWDRPPRNRWSFQHVREILPTVEVWRGREPVRKLPCNEQQLDGMTVLGINGEGTTLAAFLDQTYTDGFLVLRGGAVVFERYFNGMDERTLHLSQSLSKSFVGALTGILAGRGIIDVNAEVTDIIPDFRPTAYRGATIQHLLDMASGVRFNEDYNDPLSDMGRVDVAAGWKPVPPGADSTIRWPQTIFDLILSLEVRDHEHGGRFSYRSIETDVLAFVLERATDKHFAQLLSDELWQKLGMEEDGSITVDSADFALADGGLNACLRDYGRFGQMILEDGAGIVPPSWIEATRTGEHALFRAPYTGVLPDGAYRNQFWIEDRRSRSLMARGVFGQLIHISWEHQVVVVKLSSWPDFVNHSWTAATLDAVRRIGAALS